MLVIGDQQQPLGALELTGQGSLSLPIGAKQRQRLRTVLELPPDAVLRRTATFPSQVRENLAQVLRYEIDRLSPFTAEQVYLDHTSAGGGRPEWLVVDLALCRRDRVQPWLERLRRLGQPVDRLTWTGAWPRANLLGAADRPPRKRVLFTVERFLAALVVILLGAAMTTPLWQRQQVLARIETDLRAARGAAIEVDEVRQALERARAGSTAVLREKVERPRTTDLLRGLTERLPDDTWVQSLNIRNGEVDIRGESAQATTLIELLERTPGLDGVGFRSPVTQVARTGNERFHISFQYVAAEAP